MPLSNEQQILVEENMGLVGAVIKENIKNVYSIGIYTYQDIFQIGCLGLIKAAREYESGKSKFCTYAYIKIRNEIFNALEYATLRRKREIVTDAVTIDNMIQDYDSLPELFLEIDESLAAAKKQTSGVVAKGIDAIKMMADGYTCREIGEVMGGVSDKYVTAWISKARAYLKKDPDILALRETI